MTIPAYFKRQVLTLIFFCDSDYHIYWICWFNTSQENMSDNSFMYEVEFPLLKRILHKKGQIWYQLGNSYAPFLWKSVKKVISQTFPICWSNTNLITCHFIYVFGLRALCRKFRQDLVEIKLQFWHTNFGLNSFLWNSFLLSHNFYITAEK